MQENDQVVKYSTLNKRVIAAAIDIFILMLILAPIMNPLSNYIFDGRGADVLLNELSIEAGGDTIVTGEMVYNKFSQEGFFRKYFIVQLITLSIMCAYTLGFWIRYGTTPGKWATGCRIVDAKTLEKLSYKQAIARLFGYGISAIPIGLGFVMIAFSETKQGLHDKLAGTAVVNFKHNFTKFEAFRNRLLGRR